MATAAARKADWVTRGEAARLLGVTPDSVSRIEAMGGLKVRRLPGTRPLYERRSINDLIAKATKEAR
jgi:hypothetical protein